MRDRSGKASVMHERRGQALEQATGTRLYPGTLNLGLDKRFAWSTAPHKVVMVPDAVKWGSTNGPWTTSEARLYPIYVNDHPAWVLRLARSGASRSHIEVLASVRLRDHHKSPVTVRLRKEEL